MRILVFFDLPVDTSAQRSRYTKFRKFLVGEGFIMMQYSVYTKIVLNSTVAEQVKQRVRKHRPKEGMVQMLVITERQFSGIEYLVGEKDGMFVQSSDRLVVL